MKKALSLILIFIIAIITIMAFQKNKRFLPPFYNMSDAVSAVKNLPDYNEFTHQKDGSLPINLVYTGSKDAPAIMFIHGSPGSWEGWSEYLHDESLRDRAFMVAVDRPGYGGSDRNLSGASLKDQANSIISAVKDSFPDKKTWIIIGHSYGGPVALRLAADYPEMVSSIFLLAPAVSPELVRVRWYNRVVSLPIIKSVLPIALKRSNDEMYLLPNELFKLKPDLHSIQKDVKVIQGEKDGIVQPKNAHYTKDALINSSVNIALLPNRGHFLPWEEYELIKSEILLIISKYK